MKRLIFIVVFSATVYPLVARQSLTAIDDVFVNKTTYTPGSTGNGLGNLILFGDGANGGGWQSSIKWSGLDGFNASSSDGTRVNAAITVGNISSYGKADLIFKTKGTDDGGAPAEKLRITSLGRVGIGTTSPSEKFHIEGSGYVRSLVKSIDNHAYYIVEGAVGSGAFVDYNRTGTGRIWHTGLRQDNNNLEFRLDNQNVVLTLTDGEKVGIGTRNPDQKLTVKGNIHSEEIIVDLNVPGPDYVFEAEYELASLAEIEAFIKANKHLPEVPSAAQMEEEGIVLGQMNMLLLKKIEELTLYTIEQQKLIEELQLQLQKD